MLSIIKGLYSNLNEEENEFVIKTLLFTLLCMGLFWEISISLLTCILISGASIGAQVVQLVAKRHDVC